ncbi:MAG: hypothetical protein ACOYM2_04980 [Rectinemataceae bacterium]
MIPISTLSRSRASRGTKFPGILPRSLASRAASRTAGLVACILLSGLALSCVTVPAPAPGRDILGCLDPTALAYIRVSGPDLAKASSAALTYEGMALAPRASVLTSSISGVAGRSRRIFAAITGMSPDFEAVIEGNWSPLGLWLSLSGSKDWRDEGGVWKHRSSGISLRALGGGWLAASTGDLDELVARLAAGGSSPLPPRFLERGADYTETPNLAWIPRPLSGLLPSLRLGAGLLGELSIPLEGALIEGLPSDDGSSIELSLSLVMDGQRSARIYLPAARIAWLFIAPELPFVSGKAEFAQADDLVTVHGLELEPARFIITLTNSP